MSDISKFPGRLLKFDAYIKLTDSLNDAIKIIKDRRLAYGQPCIVTYKAKVNEQGKPVYHVLFGIGSMNPAEPYFVNVYGDDGNYAPIDELMPTIYEILDAFSGKLPVRIKVGNTPNISDTQFKDGDIILGSAAIKQVIDSVKENSDNVVSSAAIYNLFKNFNDSLQETINSILENLNENNESISHLNEFEPRINNLDSSVDTLYIKVGQHDTSINTLYEAVFGGDSSTEHTYAVKGGRGIEVITRYGISTVNANYDEIMIDAVTKDDTALKLDSSHRIGVYWSGF